MQKILGAQYLPIDLSQSRFYRGENQNPVFDKTVDPSENPPVFCDQLFYDAEFWNPVKRS